MCFHQGSHMVLDIARLYCFQFFTVGSSSLSHKMQVSYYKVIIKYSWLGASKSSDI